MKTVVVIDDNNNELCQFNIEDKEDVELLYEAEKMLIDLWSNKEYTGGGMWLNKETAERDVFFAINEEEEEHFKLRIK